MASRRAKIALIAFASIGACAAVALIVASTRVDLYTVPTGGMAPTILGDHFDVTCPTCGARFPVAKREIDEATVQLEARCTFCGRSSPHTLSAANAIRGDRVLVARDLPIERFSVIVFRYPKNPQRTFVKRVVGLPGERIEVDGRGDLLVNGKIARKPREVQEALWLPVYDARFEDPKAPAWRAIGDASRWQISRDAARGTILAAKGGEGEAWIECARVIDDALAYNTSASTRATGDVRVSANVTPGCATRTISLALVENDRSIIAAIDPVASGAAATLLVNGKVVQRASIAAPLELGAASEVSLAYVDERVVPSVKGADVATWDDAHPLPACFSSSVRFGCAGGDATFADVKIARDVFWRSGVGGPYDPANGVTVPADAYYVLGDNSANSQDSREWGFVDRSLVIGRVSCVYLPFESRREIH